jgi:FkbH-like protein
MITKEETQRRRLRGRALASEGNGRGLTALKVAVLCSFNADWLAPFLAEAFERRGIWCEPWIGPFGQIASEMLDSESELYRFGPDVVVVIPTAEDVLIPLFQRPGNFSHASAASLAEERLTELRGCLGALLERAPRATVVAVPFGSNRAPGSSVLRPHAEARGQAPVDAFVEGVRGFDDLSPRILLADWDWHARSDGWEALRDDRLWYLARMRLNHVGLAELAELLARQVSAARGSARKVVVVDLDNTLWGGVVGEVGVGGLELGGEGLGLAYQDAQRELLKWHDAGMLLAVCSKNNLADALEVLDRHPGTVLRREHFAAIRINWSDKASNIRSIASELNLGLDSFVFLDDSPAERAWVSGALPEVLVPELPTDPADRPSFLRSSEFALRGSPTEADRDRTRSYVAAGERGLWKAQAASYDEFLRSLQLQLEFAPVGPLTLARAVQLCQRTNQFNLTTLRHTQADLEALMASGAEAFTVAVRDRFEDSGITGLAVLTNRGDEYEIDTFLLSCRVLGRRVEDAFLAFLIDHARARGASCVTGRYTPTEKNAQVAKFYSDQGFQAVEEGVYLLELHKRGPATHRPIANRIYENAGGPRS